MRLGRCRPHRSTGAVARSPCPPLFTSRYRIRYHWDGEYSFNATHDALWVLGADGAGPPLRVENAVFESRFVWDPEFTGPAIAEPPVPPPSGGAWSVRVGSPMYWVHTTSKHLLDGLLASATPALLLSVPPAEGPVQEAFHRERNAHLAAVGRGRVLPLAEMAATQVFGGNKVHFQCGSDKPSTVQSTGLVTLVDGGDCFDALNLNAILMLADSLRRTRAT